MRGLGHGETRSADESWAAPTGRSPGAVVVRRRGLVLGLLGLATGVLAWVMLTMPTTVPSGGPPQDLPATQTVATQRLIEERFGAPVHTLGFVVEASGGNVLSPAVLSDLLGGVQALRTDPTLAPVLEPVVVGEVGRLGAATIADAVDAVLRELGVRPGLDRAGEADVAEAVDAVLDAEGPTPWGLPAGSERGPDGWTAESVLVEVAVDAGLASQPGTESSIRDQVRQALQGEATTYAVAPVGDDAAEPTVDARALVVVSVAVALLAVAIMSRSYWVVAATGAAAPALLVWVTAGSHLLSLPDDVTTRVLLPTIASTVGATALLHALAGARREAGGRPLHAWAAGLSGSFGAMVAGTACVAAALLATAVSRVAAIQQFGAAGALAALAALVVMGIGAPLAAATLEHAAGRHHLGTRNGAGDVFPIVLAIAASTAISFAVLGAAPAVGVVALAFYLWLALAAPAQRRSGAGEAQASMSPAGRTLSVEPIVRRSVRWSTLVLAAAVVATGAAAWSIGAIDGDRGLFDPDPGGHPPAASTAPDAGSTEPATATVYIEGDFTSPASLQAIRALLEDVDAREDGLLARDDAGELLVRAGVLDVLADAEAAGMGAPVSRGAVRAILEEALSSGVGEQWTATEVADAVSRAPEEARYATTVELVVDAPTPERSAAVRRLLLPAADRLARDLRGTDGGAEVRLAGPALVDLDRASAIRHTALLGGVVATLAVAAIAGVATRAPGVATATAIATAVVPVWVVAGWTRLESGLDLVAATLVVAGMGFTAAWALPLAVRFRQELPGAGDARQAVVQAGAAVGGATVASAIIAVVGFAALGLAGPPGGPGVLAAVTAGVAGVGVLVLLPVLLTTGTKRAVISSIGASLLAAEGGSGRAAVRVPTVVAGRPIDDVPAPPALAVLAPGGDVPPPGRIEEEEEEAAAWVPVEPVEAVEPPQAMDALQAMEAVEPPGPVTGPVPPDEPITLVIDPHGQWVDIRLEGEGRSYVGRGEPTPRGIVEAMVAVLASRHGIDAPQVVDVTAGKGRGGERLTVVLRRPDGRTTSASMTRSGPMSDAVRRVVSQAMTEMLREGEPAR